MKGENNGRMRRRVMCGHVHKKRGIGLGKTRDTENTGNREELEPQEYHYAGNLGKPGKKVIPGCTGKIGKTRMQKTGKN